MVYDRVCRRYREPHLDGPLHGQNTTMCSNSSLFVGATANVKADPENTLVVSGTLSAHSSFSVDFRTVIKPNPKLLEELVFDLASQIVIAQCAERRSQ